MKFQPNKPIAAAALLSLYVLGLVEFPANCCGQNSTRKIRTQPDSVAKKAGTHVNWHSSYKDATVAADKSGKPIFWYVPTVGGTFMDRKNEVDRYMMAGFFSWPHLIDYLNEHYVCVKAEPTQEEQERFDLKPYKFVEPGFLIVDNRKIVNRIDQLTTQHPDWLANVIAQPTKQPVPYPTIASLWKKIVEADNSDTPEKPQLDFAYRTMISGMIKHSEGKHDQAKTIWKEIVSQDPNHPLAAKAAAEIQGLGPFTRGLEIISPIPAASLKSGISSRGSRAPNGSFSAEEIWKRSTLFLLNMQNESGGYFDSDYDFGGTDSLPNVHVAVTSLVGLALIEAIEQKPNAQLKPRIRNAIQRCFQFVSDESKLNRRDRDEILWAEAYRCRFLASYAGLHNLNEFPALQSATTGLENIQSQRGSWYHEYQNSFVTATALAALYEAKNAGAQVSQDKIGLGVQSLLKDRFANGAFPYSSPRRGPDRAGQRQLASSAGRMPLCEMALSRWGQSNQQRLRFAIEQSFKHHDKLVAALKYDDHTSTLSYGGFFFWYDMRSRTEAINAIEDQKLKRIYSQQQHDLVMSLPELDGCFVDSHELGRCYGTAMALICLAGCSENTNQ